MVDKTASLLCIYKVLVEYSDEEHFLTQQDIIDRLYEDYDLELERRTISKYISILIDMGYDIEREPKKGYALFSRVLDSTEVKFISDAVFSSKSITGKQALKVTEKLNSFLSKYQRKSFNYLVKSESITRTSNNDIFLNIEVIEEAIKRGQRVSFQYLTFDENGKAAFRKNGYRYTVSPYYLINNFGKYYLLCNYNIKYQAIQVFRLDYIANIQIDEERKLKPLKSLEGMANFNITDYLNQHIYLFGNKVIEAVVEVLKPDNLQQLDEWFGKKAKVFIEDGKIYARIKCDEGSLFYWMLQYGDEFTLISPKEMIEKLKNHYLTQLDKYK